MRGTPSVDSWKTSSLRIRKITKITSKSKLQKSTTEKERVTQERNPLRPQLDNKQREDSEDNHMWVNKSVIVEATDKLMRRSLS